METPPPASSSIWDYFVKQVGGNTAKCVKCDKILKANNGATTALYGHLKSLHGLIVKKRNELSEANTTDLDESEGTKPVFTKAVCRPESPTNAMCGPERFTRAVYRPDPEPNTISADELSAVLADLGHTVSPAVIRSLMRKRNLSKKANPKELPPPEVPEVVPLKKRKNLPSYIPDYFPAMPTPNAYISLHPTEEPPVDYADYREKLAKQKRDYETSLITFYAQKLPCFNFFPEKKDLFPMIAPKPVSYFDALMHRDQKFGEVEKDEDEPPINYVRKETSSESLPKGDEVDKSGSEGQKAPDASPWELIDNPFLRPVRQSTATNNYTRILTFDPFDSQVQPRTAQSFLPSTCSTADSDQEDNN